MRRSSWSGRMLSLPPRADHLARPAELSSSCYLSTTSTLCDSSRPAKAARRPRPPPPTMSSSPRSILFVTGNANKLKEVRAILLASAQSSGAPAPFTVESQDLDLPEIQGTTQEVARAKVSAAADAIGGPCITEVRRCFSSRARAAGEHSDEPASEPN